MDFEKALSILGLSRSYTEDDLKKAYRMLMKKYHPDFYGEKSEKEKEFAKAKTQEINAAKEYLEKCLKDRTRANSSYGSNTNKSDGYGDSQYTYYTNPWQAQLSKAKDAFKNELNSVIEDLNKIKTKGEILIFSYDEEIIDIVSKYLIRVEKTTSLLEFVVMREIFYKQIERILDEFASDYSKKYNIDITGEKLENKSLKELYEQLEELRKKQQEDIDKLLQDEIDKYVYFAGYEEIKELIFDIKSDIIEKYKKGVINREEVVSTLIKKILKEFDEYYKRLSTLKEIKDEYADTTDIRLLNMIKSLAENITNPDKFKIIENKIINYIADSVKVKPFADDIEIEENIKIINEYKKINIKEENIYKPRIKKIKKKH